MDTKLLVLDIDGTLLNSEKKITPKTLAAINEMMERGHKVCLASGRPTPGVRHTAHELKLDTRGGYLLNFNGALVKEARTGETILETRLKKEYVSGLYDFAEENNLGIMTYADDIGRTGEFSREEGPLIYFGLKNDKYLELEARINDLPCMLVDDFKGTIDFAPYKILFTMEPERGEQLERKLVELFGDRLSIMRSEAFFLEAMAPGITKASALEELIKRENISHENVICCGDGYNDISMVEWAGIGVAMENARDEVKAVSDYITASNDNDGIAEVVEKFILN